MRLIKDILYKVSINAIYGSTEKQVQSIEFDSREVKSNSLFVAQKGLVFDGHKFIDKAISLGASAIVCEDLPTKIVENVTYIQVEDSNSALAIIASNFYDNPSSKLKLVGVTGTNGKTTITTLLYQLFQKAGYKTGLLSTVKIMVDTFQYEATHTTPNSVLINKYLNEMVELGIDYCFMEVSSHGIHQKRTEGLQFSGGVFTNLTHDHLDYHKTFKEYRDVKKSFFDGLPKSAFALVNIDDKNGGVMLQNTIAKKYGYALKTMANFKAKILENQFSGLLLNINGNEVWTKLTGSFNAYNLVAVYGVANLLGLDSTETLTHISELESVSGRFQHFISSNGITAVIDYAHTPDALKNVLETINNIKTGNEQIITVVGCGGDRDKAKRPIMGRIASQLSTQVIFTSDNPRSENPQSIIEEIEAGVEPQNFKKTVSILDREQAIKTATKFAHNGDIILIAGKGHETYQEVNGKRSHFDDYEKITKLLKSIES
ncbi:MAG: UDP-N-acetylmuramoyl-L-alanyl-D-glutamate--2,6-diaminopimelate ligase [Lutibacter sp.]|uniref:UDP-N-acetylmuramoyl-L-alanyl-D-glutamate--2, 6-diaminopimelate ligase n=1 Tax=Lutibacter sp. TaxID=1925666 RepID=UPI0017BEF117|nr:UDP-N-acetylmuramoyl-L-alanyl-D-glutamate--2,6-diaminopimelate ligase [Lutibacter sp.]MBT8316398.1 UDP-N-acetylmuramoyl-L-alanyl-D-glutamate--2,6-diaminopimelate ligase [Lutibacter sp.]NNJ57258.1 UDP-N-acetylmuramoyl-L-alanyl-D-glutamate--2,6-diaminopimelate ligase [Lutibacter sp.]